MARVRKPTVKTFNVENAKFGGISAKRSAEIVQEALDDISALANIDFKKVKSRPRLKIRFYNNDKMHKLGRTKRWVPLGLKLWWGAAINNERKINEAQARAVTIHEVLHWLGARHSNAQSSIMNTAMTSVTFNKADIAWLVRRYRKRPTPPRVLRTLRNYKFPDGYRCHLREVV
jgi:truncated hemoglobin YjbI